MHDHLWIEYKKGFKYQLTKRCIYNTSIRGYKISTRYITLAEDGCLTIYSGYAWDGPSGPTIDTKNFMRGSLIHDALYQLIREGHLPHQCRQPADAMLYQIIRQDGMCKPRACYVYRGVRVGAGFAADPSNKKKVIKAP